MEHIYGIDQNEDLKALYGENYEECDFFRKILWTFLGNFDIDIRRLNYIIQNPIPITINEYEEWGLFKNKVCESSCTHTCASNALIEIDRFVVKYHLKSNILSNKMDILLDK